MSDVSYSDDDEQRSLYSQGSVGSYDSSTLVTHKNLLPLPPKLNLPNKPKKISKSTMAAIVQPPKTKACAAKGKGQKCSHKKWEEALEKANVTINNLQEVVASINHISRDNHQQMNQYIGELETHGIRQLKQGQMIVKENHTLLDKLSMKERALSDTKEALKKEKERTKDLERKLKKSESDKKKAQQKLEKSVDEANKLKNDLKSATASTKTTISNEEKLHMERERLRIKHEMKIEADLHAQNMKERDEERKNKLKYQKWGKMTGGGTGSWNDHMVTVKGPGYSRSRSGSYDSRRRGRKHKHSSSRRQESRRRSRSSSRGRSRYRSSRRSRSRSYSSSRSRSKEYESHRTKYPRSSNKDGRHGLSYQQQPVPPAYHGQYQQAPMVQQWDWGAGNSQESKWVPNPALQSGAALTPVASSYPHGENEHPNSPTKPPNPQNTTGFTLPAQQLFQATSEQPTSGDTMMHMLAHAALGGEAGTL